MRKSRSVKAKVKNTSATVGSDVNRLELVEGSSNNFWQISVDGLRTTLSYGKIGSNGVTQVTDHIDKKSAAKFVRKQLAAKRKEGYVDAASAANNPKFTQNDQSTTCDNMIPTEASLMSSLPEEILAAVVDFIDMNELRVVATTSQMMLTAVQRSLNDRPGPISYSREELTQFFAGKFVGSGELIAADDLPAFSTFTHIRHHVANSIDGGGFTLNYNGVDLHLMPTGTEYESCSERTCWSNTQTRTLFIMVKFFHPGSSARLMVLVYDLPHAGDLQTNKIALRQKICLVEASEIENTSDREAGWGFDGRASISGNGSVLAVVQHIQSEYHPNDGYFLGIFDVNQEPSIGGHVSISKKHVITVNDPGGDGMNHDDAYLYFGMSAHGGMLLTISAMEQCRDRIDVWDTRAPMPSRLGECPLPDGGCQIDFDDFRCNNRVTAFINTCYEKYDHEKNMSIQEIIQSRGNEAFDDFYLKLPAFLKPRRCVLFLDSN